jgi:hypothetical protein
MIKYFINYCCGFDLLMRYVLTSGSPVANLKSDPNYSASIMKSYIYIYIYILTYPQDVLAYSRGTRAPGGESLHFQMITSAFSAIIFEYQLMLYQLCV